VKSAGKESSMRDFKDKSLTSSKFIFDLLSACSPEAINFDNVAFASSDEEKIKNASYAISCARKMGCTVFLLPEDIVEVKDKLLMTFFGAVMQGWFFVGFFFFFCFVFHIINIFYFFY
jgi:hypothetical protein